MIEVRDILKVKQEAQIIEMPIITFTLMGLLNATVYIMPLRIKVLNII